MDSTEIAKIVKYHRKQGNLTQEGLAKLAGVGKTVIYDIEKSKPTIKLDTLLKVFNALNIKIILETPLMKIYKEQEEHQEEHKEEHNEKS